MFVIYLSCISNVSAWSDSAKKANPQKAWLNYASRDPPFATDFRISAGTRSFNKQAYRAICSQEMSGFEVLAMMLGSLDHYTCVFPLSYAHQRCLLAFHRISGLAMLMRTANALRANGIIGLQLSREACR